MGMKVLLAAAEIFPLVKTGGLADVVAELAVKYDELVELYGGRTRA